VVVEGPLAGGHLGFGMDWAQYDLAAIVAEIQAWLKARCPQSYYVNLKSNKMENQDLTPPDRSWLFESQN